MPTTVLIVDGVSYDQSDRKQNSLVIDAWGWDLDGDWWAEFHEVHRGPTPKFAGPVEVEITVDGTTRFLGDLASCQPAIGDDGRRWGYRALGLKYRANMVPVTAIDGSGTMAFNLPPESEDYVLDYAGLSIGDIIAEVLDQHSTALTAIGITTDSTTDSQLAALTLVPQDPVYVSGERLWLAIENAMGRWARNHRIYPGPDGLVRVVDISAAGTTHTLYAPGHASADPIDVPQWSHDWTHCGTRVVCRGRGRIRPAYVSLDWGTLVPTWDSGDEAAWTWAEFDTPGDAYDEGTVTSVLGPTSVRVESDNSSRTWDANFWSDRKAWVYLRKTSGTGLTYQEAVPVTACTALTAGGTSDLTLGIDLDNSGTSDYDSYKLVGKVAPAGEGLVNVYRLYDITTPGGWVEEHLVPRFPVEVPFVGYTGLSAQNTLVPMGQIIGPSGNGFTQSFRVLPSTGQLLFDRPVVEQLNDQSNLDAGGAFVTQPADIYVLLAYSRGALSAVYPPDSGGPAYSGTAYTEAGLERTLYADVEQWLYEGNQDQMEDLAEMIHGSISDSIKEATIRYRGVFDDCYSPDGGHTISTVETDRILGTTRTTAAPVRAFTLRYLTDGGGMLYSSEMRCTTRRDPRTDQTQYTHLCHLGSGASQISFGFGAGLSWESTQAWASQRAESAISHAGDNAGFYSNPGAAAVEQMGAAGAGAVDAGGMAAGGAAGGIAGRAQASIDDFEDFWP